MRTEIAALVAKVFGLIALLLRLIVDFGIWMGRGQTARLSHEGQSRILRRLWI